MKQKKVALVPVREGSVRVKNKNFRPFAGEKSLLHLKLKQLKNSACFDHIYVSSDSETARNIAEEMKVEFLYRDPQMCEGDTPWSDVIHYMASSIPGDPVVCLTYVTCPFQQDYSKAVKEFVNNQSKFNNLISVEEVHEFFVDSAARPLNHQWGVWHSRSQDLKPLYKMTNAIFIAKKEDMIKWRYMIGTKIFLYNVSKLESIDIDTPADYEFAELVFNSLKKR